MKKFKEIFVCDQCGFESDNAYHFREFVGNEVIPAHQPMGLVGNNLWDMQKTQIPQQLKEAIQRKELTVFNHNNSFLITSTTLCLSCAIKTQLISLISDKSNKFSPGEMRKYEINVLVDILHELGIEVSNPLAPARKEPIQIESDENVEYEEEYDTDDMEITEETSELPDFTNAFQKRLDVKVKKQEEQ